MDQRRWEQIEAIFQAAVDKAEDQRQAYLDQVCAGDADLRSEVEALLAVHENQGARLEVPALEQVAQAYRAVAHGRLAGQRLGSYEVLSLLGRGGMGEVYLARDTKLDRQVALKVLPAEVAEDPERLRRFVREAKAASALDHPNIAMIHEIDEADGVHYLVMEYVKGETLEQRIHGHLLPSPARGGLSSLHPSPAGRGQESSEYALAPDRGRGSPGEGARPRLTTPEILDIGIQVADALEAAHAKGIVHRDIKPANLMLTPRGQVKVLDFGLAKRFHPVAGTTMTGVETESETSPGMIMGTVEYMSPEQVLGQEVDQRTDLFSLGVVLYSMATGRLPFRGTTRTDTMYQILHTEPEAMALLNRDVPVEFEQIVKKCLEKDCDLRYQHASDLHTDLKRLKRDTDSERVAVTSTQARRRQYTRSAVVVMAAVALAVVGWYWLNRSHHAIEEAPLTLVPLTTYRGLGLFPSFSSDGTQVAFEWCQEGQNCHIYIKQIGVEPPFQLTNAALDDGCPAWSPDGQYIAFFRELGQKKVALILIPQRGGPERQLETWNVSSIGIPLDGPYLAWTPDSKWLAFPYVEDEQLWYSLFMISVETGEKRRLTTPSNNPGDTAPAISPDGRTLVFTRESDLNSDLYLLRLGEAYKPLGEPRRVETGQLRKAKAYGPPRRVETGGLGDISTTWTPDGRDIVFSSGDNLWMMDPSKTEKPMKLGLASDNARTPSISRTGNRMSYTEVKYDSNIWRVDLEGPNKKAGRPKPFICSTREEKDPSYSVDGRRIAFLSMQSGASEVWVCDSDGRNAKQLTTFGYAQHGPRWSPDGKSIAFHGQAGENIEPFVEVYIVSANGGVPRRMTNQPDSASQWPFWSHDGRWLYFAYTGDGNTWKMPSQGGEAIQVTRTKDTADVPQESPDGKFLYYCRGWPFAQSVWKIPVEGGEEAKVLDSVHPQAIWTLNQEGIHFITAPDEKGISEICFYSFATRKIQKILKMERPAAGGIAVSPDGRTILYSQEDEFGANLMLVENFK